MYFSSLLYEHACFNPSDAIYIHLVCQLQDQLRIECGDVRPSCFVMFSKEALSIPTSLSISDSVITRA